MIHYNTFDILGPIMIGPSSSHTAGAVRIANAARRIANGEFHKVTFFLHGSFAKTYKGHGTDRALLAGIMGFGPDDERIRYSFDIADEQGIKYQFAPIDLGDVHPNSVKIVLTMDDGRVVEVTGSSIGGGNIVIIDVDGIAMNFSGQNPTLLIKYPAQKGIIAFVASTLSNGGYNIENLQSSTQDKIETLIVELNDELTDTLKETFRTYDKFVFSTYLSGNRR